MEHHNITFKLSKVAWQRLNKDLCMSGSQNCASSECSIVKSSFLTFLHTVYAEPTWYHWSQNQAGITILIDFLHLTVLGWDETHCRAGLRFQQFTSRANFVYSPAWSCSAVRLPNKSCCYSRLCSPNSKDSLHVLEWQQSKLKTLTPSGHESVSNAIF